MDGGDVVRILVCGDRHWDNRAAIAAKLRAYANIWVGSVEGLTIIEGGANGADTLAGEVARGLGLELEVYEAEWKKYGRAAGPIRNAAMLASGVDLVLAFHHDLEASKGTANMVRLATRAGVPVVIVEG